jgi:hypothetical protein
VTVEAWVTYTGTAASGSPTIVYHTDAAGGEAYRLYLLTGANPFVAFGVTVPAGFRGVRWLIPSGQLQSWTHIAGCYDGANMTLWVNGSVAASRTGVAGDVGTGGALRIGNGDLVGTGANTWEGAIDEVRVWPFARTTAEIQETMNDTLVLVPNGVSFNFDGDFVDSSQFLFANATAGVTFGAGTTLNGPILTGGLPFGAPSTTCAVDMLRASIGSTSRAGNLDFALVCVEAPVSAMGGVLLAAGQSAVPLPLLGFDIWVDPVTLLPLVPPVSSDPVGTARLPISLTASTQIGLTIHAQFVFLDAACGPSGLVGSEGIAFTVQ